MDGSKTEMSDVNPFLAAAAPKLVFAGEWPWGWALIGSFALGAVVFVIYWRALRGRDGAHVWGLPLLRASAVAFVFFMLAGPVLRSRQQIGQMARVLVYVDASASMTVTDERMELGRKLRLAGKLGWVAAGKLPDPAFQLGDGLAKARAILLGVPVAKTIDVAADSFRIAIEETLRAMDGVPEIPLADRQRFRQELAEPLKVQGKQPLTKEALSALLPALEKWERELGVMLTEKAKKAQENMDAPTKAIVDRFDKLPRFQRLEALLLTGEESRLQQMSVEHNVELLALTGKRFKMLWWPESVSDGKPARVPQTFDVAPTNMFSNLNEGIIKGVDADGSREQMVVVLISDGQHNNGPSPLDMARQFKERSVPIYALGVGSTQPQKDIAILAVKGPNTVFPDARVAGEMVLLDGIGPGKSMKVRIEHKGVTVWEREFATSQGRRVLPFDFAIKDTVDGELARQNRDLRQANLPLAFQVIVDPLPEETNQDNNRATLRMNVITQKPRVLIVDGRPRWELRYLRNLFERDDRWEVNTVQAGLGGTQPPLLRGSAAGQFPSSRDLLLSYQLIILGDMPTGLFTVEELQWLRDFVQSNGGGLIMIDGRQERMESFSRTPLNAVIPVEFAGRRFEEGVDMKWRLRSGGGANNPFSLLPDVKQNAELWTTLQGPRWLAVTKALPGAETLLEVLKEDVVYPAFVFWRVGSGRVLYCATDETWRWRYETGDLHHQKVWNQISKWIIEPPFSVQDGVVAIDAGGPNYEEGEAADIRLRFRDPKVQAMLKDSPEAMVSRNGKPFARLPLNAETNAFVFRGRTAALPPGDYKVNIRLPGFPEDHVKAFTEFSVLPNFAGEMGLVQCDEAFLRQMAQESGGAYYREEDVDQLLERLKPYSAGKIIISETALWQSYWWFTPVILLVAVEWFWRKQRGLI